MWRDADQVTNEVLVEDEEEIAEGDLITVRVSVTRGNLDEGEKAPDVHAPYFPTVKQEGWWFILATETKYIITMEKVRRPHTGVVSPARTRRECVGL